MPRPVTLRSFPFCDVRAIVSLFFFGSSVAASLFGSSVAVSLFSSSVAASLFGSSVAASLFGSSVAVSLFSSSVAAEPVGDQLKGPLDGFSQKVRKVTLPNGVRLILYKRGEAPVFSGAVVTRVGGSDEVPGITGISHMFEHMAFKGTPTLGTKDFSREKILLERLETLITPVHGDVNALSSDARKEWDGIHKELRALWVGEGFTRELTRRGATGLNATTDTELTRYFESMPSAYLKFWCETEAARISEPVMRQFYQERDVVMEERRMRSVDDPAGQLYEMLLGTAFLQHPYRNPVIGYQGDISTLTASETDSFRRKYYVGSNIVVGVVGALDIDRDLPILSDCFSRIPQGVPPPRPKLVEPPQQGERTFVVRREAAPQGLVAYRKPNYPHADDPPLTVLGEILAGGRLSRLHDQLVEKERIASSVDSTEAPGNAYPNLFIIDFVPRAPHGNREVLRRVEELIDVLRRKGVSTEEVARAQRALAVGYLAKLASSMSLALDLATTEIVYGDWRYALRWYDEAMAVTPADVRRVAENYLTEDNRTVGFLEPLRTPVKARAPVPSATPSAQQAKAGGA